MLTALRSDWLEGAPPARVPADGRRSGRAVEVIGLLAVTSSLLYFVSDVIEVVQGGFSTGQLWLTLVAEATVPILVI
jgi:hypothetical protein